MAKGDQDSIPGFEQKRVQAIERAASKADEKRAIIGGLSGELENLEYKLSEAMHANEAELDRQQGPNGEELLVYKRGDFNIKIKKTEKVNYKIKAASKGEEPESA